MPWGVVYLRGVPPGGEQLDDQIPPPLQQGTDKPDGTQRKDILQADAQNRAVGVFRREQISILVVFLCLAALYESWSVPFSVIMVIPLGLLGAALATTLRGLSNDVYFQVALLTTIGLSSKNAILIVEFAESAVDEGYSLSRAAIRAAQTRLRPIVMTSLAFIAGVLPLAIATGAGANSRVAIGTGIIGGTLTATLLAVFFVPLFFVLVKRLFTRPRPSQE